MTRACTLAAVRESLTAEQWERLEAINPHLRAPVAKARARGVTTASAPVVAVSPERIDVLIPGLRLDVTANSRMHWSARARAVKAQRKAVAAAFEDKSARGADLPPAPG